LSFPSEIFLNLVDFSKLCISMVNCLLPNFSGRHHGIIQFPNEIHKTPPELKNSVLVKFPNLTEKFDPQNLLQMFDLVQISNYDICSFSRPFKISSVSRISRQDYNLTSSLFWCFFTLTFRSSCCPKIVSVG